MWFKRPDYAAEMTAKDTRIAKLEADLSLLKRQSLARITQLQAKHAADLAAAHKQVSDLTDKLVTLAQRPTPAPIIVDPPDTAKIVAEAINGMATVLNGWRENPASGSQPQVVMSMTDLGLDNRAGVPDNLDDFIPPWEDLPGMPKPGHGGFVNGTIGNYTPYVPGQGNTLPPKGGVE